MSSKPVEILLVEDNPGDVRLAKEAFHEAKLLNQLNVVENGVDAVRYLRKQGRYEGVSRPDLIVLDLNLPGKNGREVLQEIKQDPALRQIPVVVLTSSEAEQDIARAYDLHANCYIHKPLDLERFVEVIKAVDHFWFTIVKLPRDDPAP